MRDDREENASTQSTANQSSTELMLQSLMADFERLNQQHLDLKAPIDALKTELRTALNNLDSSMNRLNSSTSSQFSIPVARR